MREIVLHVTYRFTIFFIFYFYKKNLDKLGFAILQELENVSKFSRTLIYVDFLDQQDLSRFLINQINIDLMHSTP